MDITLILCTYNRCESLVKALQSVAMSTMPESVHWEVLVVDNNSTDQTREMVKDFCERHPDRFRYLFEPQQGKSHALNAGIRNARGVVLAFTDDDVIVEPTWMFNLTASLHNGGWAGAGGCVLPDRAFTPPRWLPRKDRYALAPFALFDLGPEAGQLTEPPFGANMAYRKEMFEKHGGFRADLGPRPGSEIRNEDTEFGHRLLDRGERLRYEPSAVVYHPVIEARVQKKYLLAWWLSKARADVREFGVRRNTRWFAAGIPLFLFRRLAVWTLRWLVSIEPSRRFSCKLKVWTVAGTILECVRQSRAPS